MSNLLLLGAEIAEDLEASHVDIYTALKDLSPESRRLKIQEVLVCFTRFVYICAPRCFGTDGHLFKNLQQEYDAGLETYGDKVTLANQSYDTVCACSAQYFISSNTRVFRLRLWMCRFFPTVLCLVTARCIIVGLIEFQLCVNNMHLFTGRCTQPLRRRRVCTTRETCII